MLRESLVVADSRSERKKAAAIVLALIDKVDGILVEMKSAAWPEPGKQWHKLRALAQRGIPNLDRGWYYFGLLDCASQIAAFVDPSVLPKAFVGRIEQLILRKASREYCWKAVSRLILIPANCQRPD